MGAQPPNALRTGARTLPNRTVWLCAGLILAVIAAAGLAGTPHFGGARFYPHITSQATGKAVPGKLPTEHLQHAHRGNGGLGAFGTVLVILAIVVAIAVASMMVWMLIQNRRSGRTLALHRARLGTAHTAEHSTPDPEPEVLLTGIEAALQALDAEHQPADAVVRAWLGLEQTAQESGLHRSPSETPTEFTTRIMSAAFADDQPISTLLRLYQRTRFGDHPVSAEDVATVREALSELVENWRSAARQPAQWWR